MKVNLNLDKKSNFRSSILDREGNILSKSIITTNVGINPKLVKDKKKCALGKMRWEKTFWKKKI